MRGLVLATLALLGGAPAIAVPPAATAAARAEPDVKRGDSIAIVVRSGALEIRANGRALSSGMRGERVRIFNESTRRTLEGTVDAPGIVIVAAR